MRIGLIQQTARPGKVANLTRALAAVEVAAARGAERVAFAELAREPFYSREPARGDFDRLAEPKNRGQL